MIRKLLLLPVLLSLFAWPVSATWSIVVVNRRTGEVAVGSATCLQRINLTEGLPVIAVGKGAGAIQAASGGESGLVIMFDMFQDGATPQEILSAVKAADPRPQSRQIGIVGQIGAPVTFTGNRAQGAKGGVVGEVGDLAYAIQGNVLTGKQVWLAAEQALIGTPGDLAEKLMAAMQAARAFGGDGRCSCSISNPPGCGAPPPSFEKSAHVGFMIIARVGDEDPPCTNGNNCARGGFYMRLNVRGSNALLKSPDPVFQLQALYDTWRMRRTGKADAILSTMESVESLPADGVTMRTVTVRLVDLEGTPLPTGGETVQVATLDGTPSLLTVGPVADHGDGSYSFDLTAGTQPGTDTFVITASAGQKVATLYPYLTVRTDPVSPLHAGYGQVSAASPTTVPFVVNAPGRGGARYAIVASLSGTVPGTVVGDLLVPLNEPLISVLGGRVDEGTLPGTVGRLDATGRAEGAFVPPPALLQNLVGQRIEWSAVVLDAGGSLASPPVGLDVLP